jgi:hypothetical protein
MHVPYGCAFLSQCMRQVFLGNWLSSVVVRARTMRLGNGQVTNIFDPEQPVNARGIHYDVMALMSSHTEQAIKTIYATL